MKNSKLAIIIGAIVVLVGAGYLFSRKQESPVVASKETNASTPPVPTTPVTPGVEVETPTTTVPVSQEKKVRTQVTYHDPSGESTVAFTLSVDKNGMITDALTEVLATNPIATKRQEAFAKDLPSVVKGKKLSELTAIDRVGGSSLTTKAFNDALATLKAEI